jgi:hypothetical protein
MTAMVAAMSNRTHYETAFIISMMPADLEEEVNEMLRLASTHPRLAPNAEDLNWWKDRSPSDFEELANHMMQDESMWNEWRRNFKESLSEIRAVIEKRGDDE